jgi:hypothetical protein
MKTRSHNTILCITAAIPSHMHNRNHFLNPSATLLCPEGKEEVLRTDTFAPYAGMYMTRRKVIHSRIFLPEQILPIFQTAGDVTSVFLERTYSQRSAERFYGIT